MKIVFCTDCGKLIEHGHDIYTLEQKGIVCCSAECFIAQCGGEHLTPDDDPVYSEWFEDAEIDDD